MDNALCSSQREPSEESIYSFYKMGFEFNLLPELCQCPVWPVSTNGRNKCAEFGYDFEKRKALSTM